VRATQVLSVMTKLPDSHRAAAQDALVAALLAETEAATADVDDGSMARAVRLVGVGNPVAAISGFQPTAGACSNDLLQGKVGMRAVI
jgi:hypothetical protein